MINTELTEIRFNKETLEFEASLDLPNQTQINIAIDFETANAVIKGAKMQPCTGLNKAIIYYQTV
jgi:hypothetical protein